MSDFKTMGVMFKNAETIYSIVPGLIVLESCWVAVTPYPDGEYLVETKDEPNNRAFFAAQIEALPKNSLRWAEL